MTAITGTRSCAIAVAKSACDIPRGLKPDAPTPTMPIKITVEYIMFAGSSSLPPLHTPTLRSIHAVEAARSRYQTSSPRLPSAGFTPKIGST